MASVNLAWDDNSTDETNFVLERKRLGEAFAVLATLPANTTTYTDATLLPDVYYVYRVKATNAAGDSGYSNELLVRVESLFRPGGGLRVIYV